MLIKTITDNENGRKWEIYKESNNNYSYRYYEYYKAIGWRLITSENNYSKDCIEYEFDIEVA